DPGPHGLVQTLLDGLVDRLLIGLGDPPLEQVVGPDVGPALVPAAGVGQERDPGLGVHPEVMPAIADVVVGAQHCGVDGDAAAGAVGGQGDRRQLASADGHLLDQLPLAHGHQTDSPPSTTRTWPVMKAARGEHRNATAEATSSAVPSRCRGVILTSSATISSVSDPIVSSV